MARRRQAEKIRLIVKGKPSAETMPVDIGLSLPCMRGIRKRLGIAIRFVDGKPIRFSEAG